jgi:predicted phage terminase large subunit-like protein
MRDRIINSILSKKDEVNYYAKELYNPKLSGQQRDVMSAFLRKYSLTAFIPFAFKICDPASRYVHNWHVELIAEYLEAAFRGEIKRLIINIPPRLLKSISASVAFPAWALGHNPALRFLCVSKKEETGLSLSMWSRQVCGDERYGKMFPNFNFAGDQNQKGSFNTTQNGCRETKTSHSIPTGKGYNFIMFDDFLAAGMTKTEISNTIDLYPQFYSRLNSKNDDVIIAIEQRLGYNDFTAYLKEKWGSNAEHLELPAIEKEKRIIIFGSKTVERQEKQLLNEHYKDWSLESLQKIKSEMGSLEFETQFQQNPSIEGGNIIQRDWLKKESFETMQNRKFEGIYLSCDTAFKDKEHNDPSALLVFGLLQGKIYLIDRYVERLIYPHLKDLIKRVAEKHLSAIKQRAILIEDKASGQSVVQEFQTSFRQYNPIPIKPQGDKLQRLSSASPFIEAGNLVLPEDASWLLDFENELLGFPNTKHDDQVDALSQMINWYLEKRRRIKAGFITGAFSEAVR